MAGKRMPLVAGNWKMHNNHLEALALTQQLAFRLNDKDFNAADIAVLPPFTALRSVQTLVQGDKLRLLYGAQDVSPHADGAYTGDVSARMLAKLGCAFVLAGHSERRQHHHEDDALVNAKVRAIFSGEMTPILCLGESLETREAGEQLAHCLAQLHAGLAGLSDSQVASLVIAYEPIWAIGTGMRFAGRSGSGFPVRMVPKPALLCVSCMGDQSSPTTCLPSWRNRISTAHWSAAPASITKDSRESAGIVRRIPELPWRGRALIIAFSIVLILTSLLMVVLVLLHKGKGGGLSDLFGGGMSSSLGSSSVVERNLDRITIFTGVLWFVCIVALGLLLK